MTETPKKLARRMDSKLLLKNETIEIQKTSFLENIFQVKAVNQSTIKKYKNIF